MNQLRRRLFPIAAAKALGIKIPQSILARGSGDRMRLRRRTVLLLCIAVWGLPLVSWSQQSKGPKRIGFLHGGQRPAAIEKSPVAQLARGMADLGYTEGRDFIVEYRFAQGEYGRLPALASELVQSNVDVIFAVGTPAIQAAQKATQTIPIVMGPSIDPVASGLVRSLARPGGNTTGLSRDVLDVIPKQLELLGTLVPKLSRVAILMNTENSAHAVAINFAKSAAQKTRVQAFPVGVRDIKSIEDTAPVLKKERAQALLVLSDSFLSSRGAQIAALATRAGIPSIFSGPEDVEAGGLMSYGPSSGEMYRYAATFVHKILKGAKPADLPIEQPTKFELVLNLKTAKAMGLTFPQSVLVRADRAIE